MRTLAFGALMLLAVVATATPMHAQPVAQPQALANAARADSSCVALHWWDHGIVCGATSRREEYVGSMLVGAGMGALVGVPTGLVLRGRCNTGVGSAALRGAGAGMLVSAAAVTLLGRASRTELEARRSRERVLAQQSRGRKAWTRVRPVLTMLGTAAVGGAIIGALDGGSASGTCGDGAGSGALAGAGAYALGAGAILGTALVAIH